MALDQNLLHGAGPARGSSDCSDSTRRTRRRARGDRPCIEAFRKTGAEIQRRLFHFPAGRSPPRGGQARMRVWSGSGRPSGSWRPRSTDTTRRSYNASRGAGTARVGADAAEPWASCAPSPSPEPRAQVPRIASGDEPRASASGRRAVHGSGGTRRDGVRVVHGGLPDAGLARSKSAPLTLARKGSSIQPSRRADAASRRQGRECHERLQRTPHVNHPSSGGTLGFIPSHPAARTTERPRRKASLALQASQLPHIPVRLSPAPAAPGPVRPCLPGRRRCLALLPPLLGSPCSSAFNCRESGRRARGGSRGAGTARAHARYDVTGTVAQRRDSLAAATVIAGQAQGARRVTGGDGVVPTMRAGKESQGPREMGGRIGTGDGRRRGR